MKKRLILGLVLLVCLSVGYTIYKTGILGQIINFKKTNADMLISDVYTDKARYNPKDSVKVTIDLNNKLGKNYKGNLTVNFISLNKIIESKKVKVNIAKDDKKTLEVAWSTPQDDYKGYLVEVAADGINMEDSRNTAIDVSSTWDKFPRYGYIAEYPEQTKDKSTDIITWINKFHIDGLQFYDWQNKHQKPLPGTPGNIPASWKDVANRDIYFQVVKDYIDLAHGMNMKAANYNLIYGAYTDYGNDGIKKEWGIYKDGMHSVQDTHTLPSSWASSLAVFNPADKGWQNYIYNVENSVNKTLNFDIFHMDTLGYRGETFDYYGNSVNLPDTYTEFIDNAKKEMGVGVVFNTVNTYGLEQVAKSDVDFLYSELWPSDFPDYSGFKDTIDKGNVLTDGKKSTVIAAYMNYNSADSEGEFNEHSVRLTDAAIFAAGGDHLEIGDTGMLAKEYFPNKNLKMPNSLISAMRNYYDFIVAYENLLRDDLKDNNNEIQLDGIKTSNNGAPNTVWTYSKEKKGYDVIQMINLLGMKYSAWRDDGANYDAPTAQKDIKLSYTMAGGKVKGVYLASPDIKGGKSIRLKYTSKNDGSKTQLKIDVPELHYWDMIYIEKE